MNLKKSMLARESLHLSINLDLSGTVLAWFQSNLYILYTLYTQPHIATKFKRNYPISFFQEHMLT